jgi:hypothetical protein
MNKKKLLALTSILVATALFAATGFAGNRQGRVDNETRIENRQEITKIERQYRDRFDALEDKLYEAKAKYFKERGNDNSDNANEDKLWGEVVRIKKDFRDLNNEKNDKIDEVVGYRNGRRNGNKTGNRSENRSGMRNSNRNNYNESCSGGGDCNNQGSGNQNNSRGNGSRGGSRYNNFGSGSGGCGNR